MSQQEEQTLEALYRVAFPQAARAARQLGADLDTARDLFHDALIIYLEKRQSAGFEPKHSASAYLVGIVRILWFRKFRDDQRYRPLDPAAGAEDIPDDFYPSEKKGEHTLLGYLKKAGEKCVQLLQAFYYDQLPMQEVARRFGYKSSHSATVQKYKCLEKIRGEIRQKSVSYEDILA